jgi:hypothetical protein
VRSCSLSFRQIPKLEHAARVAPRRDQAEPSAVAQESAEIVHGTARDVRRVLSVKGAYGALLQAVQCLRRRNGHMNTLELLDLGFDGLKTRRLAEAGHHVEKEIRVRWIVPHGRVFSEQVCGTNVVDVRVVGIG